MIDVAIIGGGVAAAAAARTLAGGELSIAVVAPRAAPGPRIGESLPHSVGPILRDLGAWEDFVAQEPRRAHATFSAWGSERLVERNAAFEGGRPGWIVDRERFERRLWSGCEPSCRRIDDLLVAAERGAAGWRLSTRGGVALETRFVLDASGRHAAFARRRVAQRRGSRLLAAYDFLEHVDADVEPTAAVLIEARPEGWWYSSLAPSGRLIVAFFTDGDLMPAGLSGDADAWENLLSSAPYTARRVETAGFALAAAPRLTDAGMLRLGRFVGASWAAAGDAAAAMDPLAAHGIATALWSGRRAALAASDALDGDAAALERYAEDFAQGYAASERRLPEVYAQERRFADAPFWRRRLPQAPSRDARGEGVDRASR